MVVYAAAPAPLDENEGKRKAEMIEKAQGYIDARAAYRVVTERRECYTKGSIFLRLIDLPQSLCRFL